MHIKAGSLSSTVPRQYHCKWLAGKNHLWNDPLSVECD